MVPLPTTPGIHEIAVTLHDQHILATISIPDHPKEHRPPLVIALHYAGHQDHRHYATDYLTDLVLPGLERLGAVIIAPDCPDTSWTTERSERAVLSLIDLAAATWGADPKRVVLTGYSMGAVGTWVLASKHPDRFDVIVPMAGRASGTDTIALSVYVIHGTTDALFPASQAQHAVEMLRARGVDAVYVAGEGLGHYETSRYAPLLKAAVPFIAEHLTER